MSVKKTNIKRQLKNVSIWVTLWLMSSFSFVFIWASRRFISLEQTVTILEIISIQRWQSYNNDDKLHDSPDAIYNGMISDYQCAKIEADRLGVKIYNATRGGMLEVFERVDLDEILGLK